MIDVEVLATGSKGNCYLLTSGDTRILLDCGLPYKKTLKLLDFKLPTAVLVTHEHQDHAKAAQDFLNHGVDVYMTKGTADALKLEENHRLKIVKLFQGGRKLKNCYVGCSPVRHDAAEPVNFIVRDKEDEVQYITDTGYIKDSGIRQTKLLIEANYSEQDLKNSSIDENQKRRILGNHLSIEQAIDFASRPYVMARLKEIYLIHISARHGDGEEFKNLIQKIVGDKIKVIVAKNKELA